MIQNRDLETIIKDIEENTKMANTNLDAVKYNVRSAHEIGIRQAKDRLVDLRNEYKSKILTNIVGFFLFGDPVKVKKFSDISTADSGTIAVDAHEMYKYLAGEIAPSMGSLREFNVDQMSRLLNDIRNLAIDLGVQEQSIPAPVAKGVVTLKTQEELVDHVRTLIRSSIGDWLNNLYISTRLWEKALAAKYTVPVLVCTVANATIDEEQAMSAFNVKHNLTLDDDTEMDPTFINKMYEKYSKKNKKVIK